MRKTLPERTGAPRLSRRRFVQGIAGSAALLSPLHRFARGSAGPERAVLTGPEFDLTIGLIAKRSGIPLGSASEINSLVVSSAGAVRTYGKSTA
jgi:hypothetical protein